MSAATKRRSADHCVINMKTGSLACVHCGDTYPIHMPVSLTMVSAMGKAWTSEHRHCRPATSRREVGT